MSIELDELTCIFGDAINFRGVKAYPVKMKDYTKFINSIGLFTINKNVHTDINIIRMSYLDYMWNLALVEPTVIKQMNNILTLVFKNQRFKFHMNSNGMYELLVYPEDIKDEDLKYYVPNIISGYEFNDLRKLILDQNLIPYDDTIVDAETLKTLNDALEFVRKKNKTDTTIEDRIVAYHCYSGKDYEYIKNMTIYQFEKSVSRIDFFHLLQLYIHACASGNFEAKSLESWDKHIPKQGLYDAVMIKDEKAKDVLKGIEDFNNA